MRKIGNNVSITVIATIAIGLLVIGIIVNIGKNDVVAQAREHSYHKGMVRGVNMTIRAVNDELARSGSSIAFAVDVHRKGDETFVTIDSVALLKRKKSESSNAN